MSTKISNWRCDTRILEPGFNEITFLDTRPNVFFIINNNPTYLYASLDSIPSKTKYEHVIKPNDTDVMGRPMPQSRIYFFNPKNVPVNIKIYSDYTHFDIGLLKTIFARMDDEQLDKIKYDGVITGWQTPDVVNTFITNYDDLVEPINEHIDDNSNIIYTLMDDFKNSVQDKIVDLIAANNQTSNNICMAFVSTNMILSNINKSIMNLTDYSSYLISGINKMNTAIGLLDGILNKKCTCNGSSSTEPDPGPVEPDNPYDKNDYILTETYSITNNDTIVLDDVKKIISINIENIGQSIPITELEIVSDNKNLGPVKLLGDTTIYYPFVGTVEIYNNGLITVPPNHIPFNITVNYIKNGINDTDIPPIIPDKNNTVIFENTLSSNYRYSFNNVFNLGFRITNIYDGSKNVSLTFSNLNTNKNVFQTNPEANKTYWLSSLTNVITNGMNIGIVANKKCDIHITYKLWT